MMVLSLLAALAMAGSFEWVERSAAELELRVNGRTVFVYNHGPDRQCCYLHPVNSPSGITVTDDGPADHKHHRGIFWAWPIVRIGETRYDLWMRQGAEQKFDRIVEKRATASEARLLVEHSWVIQGKPVVRETMELRVQPALKAEQQIEVTLTFTALDQPVQIAGAPEQNKGYGGFSCRFAPRTDTTIQTPEGAITKDENHGRHKYAELSALFKGKRAGLRITAAEAGEWCLRPYGFVGANFPGVQPYTIQPGKPLKLSYTVAVFDLP